MKKLNLYLEERRDLLGNKAQGPSISRLESQYRHSHLPNYGSTASVAYAALTAVTANNAYP